jgi:pilus assembly protein Flp/PilA
LQINYELFILSIYGENAMMLNYLQAGYCALASRVFRPAILSDRRGVTAIEYAMIAGIIVVAIVVGMTGMGAQLSTTFSKVSSEL